MSSNKNPYFLPIGNSGMMKRWIVDNVDIPSIKHCHTAGVSMNPGTAVYAASDGKVYPYQIGFDSLYIGVLEDPAYVGKPVTVQYGGYLKVEGSGWQPGVAYYADNGGLISASGSGRQVAVGTGTDEIVLVPDASTELEDNKGVYFVDKRYDNAGAAVVTGYTTASITSTNPSYSLQLSLARRGSTNNPWPDPWSARNQALQDIAAGLIDTATIVVLSGEWTVGSNNSSKNGSIDGTVTTGVVADIGFTMAGGEFNNTTNVSSLLKDRLNFFFHPGTHIYFINSDDAVCFIYEDYHYSPSPGNFTGSLKGHLDLSFVFSVNAINIWINNLVADCSLEFNSITCPDSYADEVFLFNQFTYISIKIGSFIGYGGGYYFNIFDTNQDAPDNHKTVPSGHVDLNIEVDRFINYRATDVSDTQSCSFFLFYGDLFYQKREGSYNVKIKVKDLYVDGVVSESFGNLSDFEGALPFNFNYSLEIDNATILADERYWALQTPQSATCSLFTVKGDGYNALINIRCKNIFTQYPLIRSLRLNSQNSTGAYAADGMFRLNIHCDDLNKKENATILGTQTSTGFIGTVYDAASSFTPYASNGMVYISGNYKVDFRAFHFLGDSAKSYKINFSGTYKCLQSLVAVFYLDTDKEDFLSFTDVCILPGGGIGSSISAGSTYLSRIYNVFFKNVMSRTPLNTTRINQLGESVTIDSNIYTFLSS